MKNLENIFERVLWGSRLVVVVAVVASILIAFVLFYVASVTTVGLVSHGLQYGDPGLTTDARTALGADLLSLAVGAIDGYLLATILLIFALGLYELFIGKIDAAEGSEFAGRVLLIRNLDDLKDRLGKVIVLILVVKFFQVALDMKYVAPIDLLFLAFAIVLVGGALWLTHRGSGAEH
jgi:uncharacterized membrane protein YqhA